MPYKGDSINDPVLDALKFAFNLVFGEPDPQLLCDVDGSDCEYRQPQQNVVPWVPGPGWARALGIGKGAVGFKEFATRVLPKFAENGPTVGVGATSSGRVYRLVSGNKKADSELIGIVNDSLRKKGFLRGASRSSRASDVEQKMAAIMERDGIHNAEIVINNPAGPCAQPLGCDRVLSSLLGPRRLTVYWPNGKGGYKQRTYGGVK
ncbi:DddA-like double-stranded DNA deaminase toxin [Streptomyces sp. NPDC056244]|uniref:DddA-like double-stranded DNA deaminase toxin n=1 Tax=Streptomyces sp. NPDC056244 TaxID=3345762 RepID=UPI0035DC7A2A